MTKWMGLERWGGKEMMRRFRFVVWEPKCVKVIGCKSTFPIDNNKYSHVLRPWSGQRAKGNKKLELDKEDKAFPFLQAHLSSGILEIHVLLHFLTTRVLFAGTGAGVCLRPQLWVGTSLELLLHHVQPLTLGTLLLILYDLIQLSVKRGKRGIWSVVLRIH